MAQFGTFNAQYSPTVYGSAFFNKESTVDKTMLSFSMWRSTIKVGIYPLIDTDDDQVKYDRKNGLAAFLTPIKALMFSKILRDFMRDPKANHSRGVPSGAHLLTIEDPTLPNGFNKPNANPIIVIRKVLEDGTMESSYAYEIKNDPSNSIREYNDKTGAFTRDPISFKYVELEMIAIQLEEYVRAMTNAQAFSTTDTLYPVFDKLASKLGVDISQNAQQGTYKNSYFSSNNVASTNVSNYTGNSLNNMVNNNIDDSDVPF